MNYYHASKLPLVEGTILENRFIKGPRRFREVQEAIRSQRGIEALSAAVIRNRLAGGPPSRWLFELREVILERVRQEEFSHRPSRMTGIFLSPSKEHAVKFREAIRATNDRPLLYVCTVLDDAATFEADMHYVTDGDPRRPIAQQIDYFGQYARSYWQGEKCDTAVVEILAPARSVQVVAEAKW